MHATPVATFVVERERGVGYCITSSDGLRCEVLREYALPLLEELGQPDPTGPPEVQAWLRPLAPCDALVHVLVERLPGGEVRYREAWFAADELLVQPARPRGVRGFRTVAWTAFVLAAGWALGWLLRGAVAPHEATAVPGESATPLAPTTLHRPAPALAKTNVLTERLQANRELVARVRQFLSQEGLASPAHARSVEEKKAVLLRENLEFGTVPWKEYDLSNHDVRKLLDVLDSLDELLRSPP